MSHHKEILVICPTRGRFEGATRLIKSWWETTSNRSDLVFVADEDDEAGRLLWQRQADLGVKVRIGTRMCVSSKVNLVAYDNPDRKLLLFLGDDVVLRTKSWEDRFLDIAASHKYAMIWANDLHNGERLCVHWALTGALVRFLGWMLYPRLYHLYTDVVVLELAKALGIAFYLDDVIMEHLHPCVKKSEIDQVYLDAWEYIEDDRYVWEHIWQKKELPMLLEKLRPLL